MANDVVAQAPSRVNLLGDRTDYNDGFVLPLALPFKTVITATPHADNEVPPISAGYGTAAFSLTDEPSTRGLNTSPPWPTFLLMKISRQAGSMPRSRLTSPSEQACRHRRPSRWTRARQSPVSRASSPTPIDCRSLALTPIELPHAAQVIIMDTMTRREL
ncbi:MAG: hypothetical protein HOM37_10235, partial [Acidimicrobiaceae bacterium]|nr:hypothetical protein [Acidimicrobiaceae bacterium]